MKQFLRLEIVNKVAETSTAKSNYYEIQNNKIPNELVEAFVSEVEYTTEQIFGKTNTVMRYRLQNGFVGIESSTCVDEKNYSFEIGKKILQKRLEDKIWFGLGFALAMAQNQ